MGNDISATKMCEQAEISHRQLDRWITREAIPSTDTMGNPGSGHPRRIPEWYEPRLRLLGKMSETFESSPGRGGMPHTMLRRIFDAYEAGHIDCGTFQITWEVQ